MSKSLQEATLGEIVAEVQRRNPDQIIELQVGTTQRVGSVPACRREEHDRATAVSIRKAAIRLGFAKCKSCQEMRREVTICGCGIVDEGTCSERDKLPKGTVIDSLEVV
jgi:hypothetical protein